MIGPMAFLALLPFLMIAGTALVEWTPWAVIAMIACAAGALVLGRAAAKT